MQPRKGNGPLLGKRHISKSTLQMQSFTDGEASNPLYLQVWNFGTSNHTFQISYASLSYFV